jgi:gluconate 2-dehydrogenase gamma chain
MKRPSESSRRTFLSQTSGAFGSAWLASQWPLYLAAATAACSRREETSKFANLSQDLAQALEAVAEQIIPADDEPGAREAGVIWFIDQLLGGSFAGIRPALEAGVEDLDVRAGSGRRFVELSFEEQTTILKDVEQSRFFSTIRFLTIAGMFAMPGRGGNQNKVGWKLIGFEDRHAWQPPFGHYDDASVNGEKSEGEA